MTPRQRIKIKLMVAARKEAPKDYETFKASSLGTLGCCQADPEMEAELDRMDNLIGNGIGRMLKEVWNEYRRELFELHAYEAYARRQENSPQAD